MSVAKKCTTCPTVTNAIEEHHVVPLSYGGKQDGMTVAICGNCHTEVHRCIENRNLHPPNALHRLVIVGRRAKERFLAGELEARDRRPTLLIPMDDADEARLAFVKQIFNTKSRSETMLAALRFAAANAKRVRTHG